MSGERRLCVLCKHFEFHGGSQGYSEATPGSLGTLDCDKNVWHGDMDGMTVSEYRALMLKAENCKYFALADDLKDLVPK